MEILQGLACVLLLLSAFAFGALWIRRALGRPDAHTCLTLGAVAGLSAHITALNVLAYIMLPGHAAPVLFIVELLGAAGLLRALRRSGEPLFDCGACSSAARGVWPWAGLVGVLWVWTCLRIGSSDQLFHASVCEPLARFGLPATHPFDTAQVLNYHYGLDLLAASLGGCTGLHSWRALDIVMALLAPLILAGCVEFLRAAAAYDGREASRAELLFGTLLFALGGNFQWIEWLHGKADANPANRFGFGCDGIATLFPAPAHAGAWVWMLAIFALVLRWARTARGEGTAWSVERGAKSGTERDEGRGTRDAGTESLSVERRAKSETATAGDRRATRDGWTSGVGRGLYSAAIPLGLALGTVCLVAEHAAFAVGVALLVFTAWDLRRGFEGVSSLLLAGVLGLGIAALQGGTITSLALKLSGSGNLRPGPTGELWPSFPSQQGRVIFGNPDYWTFAWREYGHTLYLLPVFAVWAFAPRAPTAVRWLLGATLPCAFIALYVKFPLNEFDTYRFYQLYLGAALLATGLLCAKAWSRGAESTATAPPSQPSPSRGEGFAARGFKAAALMVGLLLCIEGLRATLVWANAGLIYAHWDYPEGQREAFAEVERRIAQMGERRDPTEERILASVPGILFSGIPSEPGILGRAVPASDPNTDVTIFRGRAWQNALDCPSPANLRTARARWVCFNADELKNTLPILEGCPDFEFIGAYGPQTPGERYRLYHYKGDWEAKEDAWWGIRQIKRYAIKSLLRGTEKLDQQSVDSIMDGDLNTVVELNANCLSDWGIELSYESMPKSLEKRQFLILHLSKDSCNFYTNKVDGQNTWVVFSGSRIENEYEYLAPEKKYKIKRIEVNGSLILDRMRPNLWGILVASIQQNRVRICIPKRFAMRQTFLLEEIYCGEISYESHAQ
ncbi:MAG: hypothetical protein HY291_18565 [Planctomycetes bacterium]|nr:hypothetical protein [Planctomycetota bacterium]